MIMQMLIETRLIKPFRKPGSSLSCRKATAEKVKERIYALVIFAKYLADVHACREHLVGESKRYQRRVCRHGVPPLVMR